MLLRKIDFGSVSKHFLVLVLFEEPVKPTAERGQRAVKQKWTAVTTLCPEKGATTFIIDKSSQK